MRAAGRLHAQATSGALVEVRFRVAAPLAGRPWGLVTRAAFTGGPGGGALRAAHRAAGARVGVGDVSRSLILSVASVCPQSGPDGVDPIPKAGGGTGVLKGRGWGQRRAARPGSLEPRVPGTTPARPLTSHSSLGLSFPAVKGRDVGSLPSLTVHARAGLEGA